MASLTTHKLKLLFGLVFLVVSLVAFGKFGAAEPETVHSPEIDARPSVVIEKARPIDHQSVIRSYGEVTPLESTRLLSEVSGRIVYLNPNFLTGGLVKNHETLFRIETDQYEARVLESEARLLKAKAALVEEQAQAEAARQQASRSPHIQHSDLFLRKPQLLSAQAEVKSAEALLKRARQELDRCDVRAPYDALIFSKDVGLGQYVMSGQELGKLHNAEFAEVLIPIPGFESRYLPANLANVRADIIHDGVRLIGRQATISRDLGVVDSDTRMSSLAVLIPDPYGLESGHTPLKFGTYVEVNFKGRILEDVYRVRQSLINKNSLWILNENNELTARTVDIVKEDGEYFLVTNGIDDEANIVVTLPEYPQEAMQVKVIDTAGIASHAGEREGAVYE